MDWIKIEDKLPEFGKNVLLSENNKCNVGNLVSIDVRGNNWNTGNPLSDLSTFFGATTTKFKTDFNPTHWCEIILPN